MKGDLYTFRGSQAPEQGKHVPEVGLELHSLPRKHGEVPETCGVRPDPAPVRPGPKPQVCTLYTRHIGQLGASQPPAAPTPGRLVCILRQQPSGSKFRSAAAPAALCRGGQKAGYRPFGGECPQKRPPAVLTVKGRGRGVSPTYASKARAQPVMRCRRVQ
jgi:hypothetical protein